MVGCFVCVGYACLLRFGGFGWWGGSATFVGFILVCWWFIVLEGVCGIDWWLFGWFWWCLWLVMVLFGGLFICWVALYGWVVAA